MLLRTPLGWVELVAEEDAGSRGRGGRDPPPPARAGGSVADRPGRGGAAAGRRAGRVRSGRVVREQGFVGLATPAGQLLMNPATAAWTFRDPSGRVWVRPLVTRPVHVPMDSLADADAVAADRRADSAGPGAVELSVGWRRDVPIAGYGGGNGAVALRHFEGTSAVGNGRAVVPYLWCPDGYAMLAVTADDAQPAHWRSDPARAVLTWTFPGPVAHLYLRPAADLKASCRVLRDLTGRAPVPPRWTLGYLQSRWGWKDRADIESTLREFQRRRMPVDAFILDFEWYTANPDYEVPPSGLARYPDFGLNPRLFPDPARQLADYHAQGLKIVAIRKPRVGDRATLAEFRQRGWMLGPDGARGLRTPASEAGRKWGVREIDFHRAEVRAWYVEKLRPLLELGLAAWWNDEGESSFVLYHFWNLAERELAHAVRPGRRFWSLNRAFSPGLQRLGATAWTGDAYATWDALAATPVHLLNWGLAGMLYGGCDSGGFRGEATPELFVRWIQAAVLFPMMRAHTAYEWTPRLPWRFGRAAEAALRGALELRYRLIPYLYSLAHESHASGLPLMRPLLMEFPEDPLVRELADEWLVGSRVLAAPLLNPGGQRTLYLPAGEWYRLGTGQREPGGRVISVTARLDEIPIYVRAGTILPLGPVVPHTAALPGGPLEVQVYGGADARFTLVEDEGETTDYEQGRVRRTTFTWNERRAELGVKVAGDYDGPSVFRAFRVKVFA